MSRIRAIHTDEAPAAIGPYSQAITAAGLLFSAGQIGLVPGTGELAGPDVESQARQVFANLAAVLGDAGLGFRDVVKTTVYLADMDEFGAVNTIYGEHFAEPYPARSTVAAAGLPKGARVEVDVIARIA
ncbi:MAG: RidA family protein [Gemmatimonadota bacterium]|nr:RidA family protein [Gemmatimonadota bacterium]MDH3427951.1 RidA family protein [Gemmatimonadota bacterium]